MKLTSSLVPLLIWILQCVAAGLAWPSGASRNRTGREVTCREGLEYPHAGICCLNCPAGTYVKHSCSRASERGICETCDFGSYTEHENGLHKCLPCSSCRSDQDLVGQCTSTQNTQCQCMKGLFCLPEQACEVCKTCSKCAEDEEVEKSCTASSNTVCRKKKGSARSSIAGPITAVVLSLMILLLMVILYWKAPTWSKRAVASCCPGGILMKKSGSDSVETRQNGLNAALEDSVPLQPFIVPSSSQSVGAWTPVCVDLVEEEDRGLGDSLPTTTTSSQNSLCVCVQPSEPCPARYSPALPCPPPALENEKLRRLIPLNGEESLKKSFDLFEEIDVHYHNRFFRLLGLSDNAITSAESLSVEERVYQLLRVWMEKEGMKADFNTLVEVLLRLNQRLSAENIIARAIRIHLQQDVVVMKATVAFYAAYLLCLVLSVVCVVLVVHWNASYRGGFAWDHGAKQFNWHPVLMVLGLVVLYGNAAVVYRIPLTWGQNKQPWKLLHAGLLLLSLLFVVVGLCAVFDFHNANNTPNLYSLHSWVGIATTALFAAQWAAGFGTFLLPWSPMALRVLVKPTHVWMGAIIFVLSIVSCISGINEKLLFVLKKNTNGTVPYAKLPPEAVLANTLGVVIMAFGLVVLKILANQTWRRPEPGSEAGEYRSLMTDES
ncbi:hypothetical protein SRHO_G00259000 [Serrasalmus rhombeus]